MAIIAFDGGGNLIKRWDKPGARYVWKIEEDLDGNTIAFIGQSEERIVMNWSELTDLVFDAGVKVPKHLSPSCQSKQEQSIKAYQAHKVFFHPLANQAVVIRPS